MASSESAEYALPIASPYRVRYSDGARLARLTPGDLSMPSEGNRTSRLTTEGPGRAPNRAMLRAVGFHDDDFSRPMVGVASLFSDITPCNAHLDRLGGEGAVADRG